MSIVKSIEVCNQQVPVLINTLDIESAINVDYTNINRGEGRRGRGGVHATIKSTGVLHQYVTVHAQPKPKTQLRWAMQSVTAAEVGKVRVSACKPILF